ncbi:helix-turn-helix domain-containing protein [Jannaschia pohangensis]|uniref:AraC-type DNA-binding domain and AraC-containing proteins n=1 Tax=Jannaschia pohangensis TaxID=390807 RepID=A0A1I3TX22_9RHOB|nr:helix-turn-helix domain-containing protein [Jannaschia pohangensis]SFJ75023.1 AraC-type DNA-binding domain and AraC-containing proteins [Jannaschia pohangensis]
MIWRGEAWVPVLSGPGLTPCDSRGTEWIGVRLPPEAGGTLPPEIRAGGILRGDEALAAMPSLRDMTGPEHLLHVVANLGAHRTVPSWCRSALAALRAGNRPGAVAREAGVSPRAFRRSLVQATGLTPNTIAALGRFHRALLLIRAGVPLAEVAIAAGFADQPHLTRACRRWGGFTPGRMPDLALPHLPACPDLLFKTDHGAGFRLILTDRGPEMKFGYTILYVADVPAMLTFWEAAFGLTRKMLHESNLYGELDTGDTTLAFAADEMIAMNGLDLRPNRAADQSAAIEVALVCDTPAKAWAQAVAAGAEGLKPTEEKPWGQIVGYVRDPNGIVVEICSPVG